MTFGTNLMFHIAHDGWGWGATSLCYQIYNSFFQVAFFHSMSLYAAVTFTPMVPTRVNEGDGVALACIAKPPGDIPDLEVIITSLDITGSL